MVTPKPRATPRARPSFHRRDAEPHPLQPKTVLNSRKAPTKTRGAPHAFYWRYDTPAELELLNQLWKLVSLRLNFFTPTKKAVGYTSAASGRRKRIYDKPATPWQRLHASGVLDEQQRAEVAARIEGINPADLTRQINAIQMRLLDLAKTKTEALAAARHVDLAALQPSINRLAKAK